MHAVHFSQLLSESFLAALEMQILFTKLISMATFTTLFAGPKQPSFCGVRLLGLFNVDI